MPVYVAERRSDGLVKIGWSQTPRKRVKSLKCQLLATFKGGLDHERGLHQLCQEHRISEKGEWFRRKALEVVGAFIASGRKLPAIRPKRKLKTPTETAERFVGWARRMRDSRKVAQFDLPAWQEVWGRAVVALEKSDLATAAKVMRELRPVCIRLEHLACVAMREGEGPSRLDNLAIAGFANSARNSVSDAATKLNREAERWSQEAA